MKKTIAAIADSVENSAFDPSRSVATVQALLLEPFVMVSSVFGEDGSKETLDVTEVLDGVFAEFNPAVFSVGYLTEESAITYISDKLESCKKIPVIARPSLISDDGDILVTEEVYNQFSERLMNHVKILIINNFEAELLSGFECRDEDDYVLAAKKVHTVYNCHVVVTSKSLGDKAIICIGESGFFREIEPAAKDFDTNKYELSSAVACGLAYGLSILESIDFGFRFCNGVSKASELTGVEEVEAAAEDEDPEPEKLVEKAADSVSFVAPGKALRDIARKLDSTEKANSPVAVTSVIDENLGKPKGEVSDLKANHGDSVTELQSLKERLEKLKEASSKLGS